MEIVNSYDNTVGLLKKFPIVDPIAINKQFEAEIQNRLLTGFENWNRGYEVWASRSQSRRTIIEEAHVIRPGAEADT